MTATTKTKRPTLMQRIAAEETTEDKLIVLTDQLGKDYDKWKATEEIKNSERDMFFALLDDFVEEQVPLDRTTERVLLKVDEDIDAALATRYPDRRVVIDDNGELLMEENPEDDREWIVVMEPDPQYVKYSFINPETGMVYTRGRTERGAGFDALGLHREFPEVADKCVDRKFTLSVPSGMDLSSMEVNEILALGTETFELNEEKAEALVVADPSLLALFMKFRIAPKISMTLTKPRKAKADEL